MTAARGDWASLVLEAEAVATSAVELAALSEPELPGVMSYLADRPVLPFQYLSLHAPSKAREMSERDLIDLLHGVSPRVDAIVVHPDTIDDVEAWGKLGRRLVIENMDTRKSVGQTAESLADYFDVLHEARLCFDIAHAWAVDPTMAVGEAILDRFGARLRQLHISSLDAEQHHVPLTAEHERLFGSLLDRCRDVPWILEAPPRLD